ncbi:MAG: N-acetylmuramoyl-L-alanine amidase [bacterium]|nr:N-acetylmuramoyl-L-alanine amidase [bacterium]
MKFNALFILITAYSAFFVMTVRGSLAFENTGHGDLKDKYNGSEFKILIVPGHDNETLGGARFKNLREADLNLKVAEKLFRFFNANPHFKVFITRDNNGYKPEFAGYFQNNYSDILSFRDRLKSAFENLLNGGLITKNTTVHHNYATEENSVKLYGINKWANENGVDLVLHAHFNDYPERIFNREGKYTGFAVYVPERQLPNFDDSMEFAQSVFGQLQRYFAISNHPQENTGVVEDQDLIAVGSNSSRTSASLLVEYSYIYEPQVNSPVVRPLVAEELAYQTYLGVKKYLNPQEITKNMSILPYVWKNYLKRGPDKSRDIFALQAALAEEGLYPPAGFSKNECGLTGKFGLCTEKAVIELQKKYGITTNGFVGPRSIKKLNELYSHAALKPAKF